VILESAKTAGDTMPVVSEDHRNSSTNAEGSRLKQSNHAPNADLKAFAATSKKKEIVVGYVRVCFGLDSVRRQLEHERQVKSSQGTLRVR
jgi:hypothetical protein